MRRLARWWLPRLGRAKLLGLCGRLTGLTAKKCPMRSCARLSKCCPRRASPLHCLPGKQATIRELAQIAGVSDGVLRGMVGAGLIEPVEVAIDRPFPPPDPEHDVPQLSGEQDEVASRLVEAVEDSEFAPFLIDGVTGSGKTEVYFEPMASAVRAGKQVLVLLPEIALTENFLVRFEQRFGAPPVLWHSSLKSTERRRAWRAIASGEAKVVVGARSALFLPYAKLGLIVVDEAHEVSFKQDDGVRYNARDVSVMRARFEKIPVVLASATPALESLAMAEAGTYEKLDLRQRYGGAQLPTIHTVDLTQEEPERGRWLAKPLVAALEDRPQPARLCPAHPMPQLRIPVSMPALQRMVGGASLVTAACLSPLRA